MKTFKIFVYGTLMEGFRNYNKYLKDSISCRKIAYTFGEMYHLNKKDCPALLEGKDKVYGEVIEFKDNDSLDLLQSLDKLETYFEGSSEVMYKRKRKKVFYEKNFSEEVYVYIFVNKEALLRYEAQYIVLGDWRAYVQKNNIRGV